MCQRIGTSQVVETGSNSMSMVFAKDAYRDNISISIQDQRETSISREINSLTIDNLNGILDPYLN